MRGNAMTSGAPWKHLVKFTIPILSGLLLQQFYHTADTLIVGKFSGEDALASVGTTGMVVFLLISLSIGLSGGCSVIVAQHFGAGRKMQMRRNAGTGIILLCAIGCVAAVAGVICSGPIFINMVKVPPEIVGSTLIYFRTLSVGFIFMYIYSILSAILRGVGDSAAILYFLLISSVVNILLDLLFVAVFGWGVAGAAAATVISQFAAAAAAWMYMNRKYPVFRFRWNSGYLWSNSQALDIVKVGFPIALQMIIVALGLSFLQRAVNSFGKAMTASFTVAHHIELYLHMPGNAIQSAIATFTGQNVGAKKIERVRSGVLQGAAVSLCLAGIMAFLVWFFADDIIRLYPLSEQAAFYCRAHLRSGAFITILLAAYLPVFGVFHGTKHTRVLTAISICVLLIRLTTTYSWKDTSFFGASIIWWNAFFGFGGGLVISWALYLSGFWQKSKDSSNMVS